jgi:alkanesulfonate monooxygenase SsuD/methylene tetrahydromethanopterin reductase-like flavin-dependent oxidoreductase (luciferase family)
VNPLRFGAFLSPAASGIGRLRENAQVAEESGFDYISVQDHPYFPGHLDTFSVIGTLIGETHRIGFMPNVANLPLRPPAMLAKTAASLDLLSGGRFDLGLGGGARWEAIEGLGGQPRSPAQAYEAMGEAITVLRTMWASAGNTVTFEGRHYRLAGAVTGPAPAHDIGIWLGAAGPRMLDLLGRTADGWVAPILTPFETKAGAQQRIDTAAVAAGRRPEEIRRVIQLVGSVTDRPGNTERPRTGPGGQPIRTTPEHWAAIVAEFAATERFDTINFLPEKESAEQLRRFATEVIPAARELAAK